MVVKWVKSPKTKTRLNKAINRLSLGTLHFGNVLAVIVVITSDDKVINTTGSAKLKEKSTEKGLIVICANISTDVSVIIK